MKKLLALVLAMTCALSVSVPAFAKSADATWGTVSVEDMYDEDGVALTGDTIRPGDTVYYSFGSYSSYDYLLDSDMVKTDVDKDEGSKYISSAKIVTKKLGGDRKVALEIVAKDNFTADELKAKIDVYITAKENLKASNAGSGNFPIYVPGTLSGSDFDVTIAALTTKIKALGGALEDGTGGTIAEKQTAITALDTLIATTLPAKKTPINTWNSGTITVGGNQISYAELAAKAADAANKVTQAETAMGISATAWADLKTNNTANETIVTNKSTNETAIVTAINALNTNAGISANGTTYLVSNVNLEAAISTWTFTPLDTSTVATEAVFTIAGSTTVASGDSVTKVISDYTTAKANVALYGTLNAADGAGTKYDAAVIAKGEFDTAEADNTYAAAKLAFEALGSDNTIAKIDAQIAAKTAERTTRTNEKAALSKEMNDLKTERTKVQAAAGGAGTGVSVNNLPKGKTMKVPMTMWIQNEKIEDDDFTFEAGTTGVVIKPLKNELNTVTYENNNGTLAVIEFTADSSSEYFMPRLSTKWNSNEDYDQYFEGADAYILSFDGNPYLPCTSRARVYIENPDEDRDINDFYAYEVVDGELIELDFENAESPETDEDAILIRTRRLGTYIFSDTPADIEDDDDYLPEDPPKVNIDQNTKPNPGTGF